VSWWSGDDIEMTREIKAAAEALGIAIYDHLVREGLGSPLGWLYMIQRL
jgi:hypothetical protein